MIQVVLFDLDDTLFDHQGCARESLAAVRQAHEALRAMPFEALERAHAGFLEDLHGEVMLGRVPLEAARVERFRRLLRAVGAESRPDLAGEIAAMYRDTYRARRRPVAGAVALMTAIKRHARVGIVSNNLLDEQQEKLQVCGLDPFVDALVVSEEAGVSKPDPRSSVWHSTGFTSSRRSRSWSEIRGRLTSRAHARQAFAQSGSTRQVHRCRIPVQTSVS